MVALITQGMGPEGGVLAPNASLGPINNRMLIKVCYLATIIMEFRFWRKRTIGWLLSIKGEPMAIFKLYLKERLLWDDILFWDILQLNFQCDAAAIYFLHQQFPSQSQKSLLTSNK